MRIAEKLDKKIMTCPFDKKIIFSGSVSVLINYDPCFSEIDFLNMEVGSGLFLIGLFHVLSYVYFQEALSFNLSLQATFKNKLSLEAVLYPVITKYFKNVSFKIISRFFDTFKRILQFFLNFPNFLSSREYI